MNLGEKTVKDFLFTDCSEGLLSELAADGSDYWQKAEKFVNENLARKLNDLTQRQRGWVITIRDGLLDEAGK